jgi:2-methylisocitrate lyase-like PEP mutase family enzyme
MAATHREKAERFRALHARPGTFVIPNPWDVGSARVLAALGFEALATTSSGFANALGRLDGQVKRDEVLDHCRQLSAATDLPVSADLERGFGDDPRVVAETIRLASAAGLSGGSIEDYTGNPAQPIYELSLAVERVHAAVEAVAKLDVPFTLTARAELLLRGRRDLDAVIARLQAYERAGADVLFAPGLASVDEVRQVTRAVGRPLNVLATMMRNVTVAELAEAGAKRISVGGALARTAMSALIRAATELREGGTFNWLTGIAAPADVARLLTGAAR